MDPLFDITGKVVVVTGGLGQLGLQFTRTLLERGARAALFDLDVEGETARAKLADLENRDQMIAVSCDVTDRTSLERALGRVVERWETPHGLINNAALDSPPNAPAEESGPFETYPLDSWEQIMKVNVTGVFLACQTIGGAMAEAGRGAIVNVASIYGLVSPDQGLYGYRRKAGQVFFKPAAYATSKSALYNLTRYLATYWGERGVRVNVVTFGGVFNNQDQAFLDGYRAKVPLRRMAWQHEYDGTIIYLLSEASSYMTGSNVVVDGGFTAW
jgi:NAD(P)-dependent dehydrogenase (short-subunit alcohol dehydrogenase family)